LNIIKILIADDHPIIRYGLKSIISEDEGLIVSGEAENGNRVFELLKNDKYDIILLDINLPDFSGIEVLERLKISNPEIPVLMLSGFAENLYAEKVILAGASGYVDKIVAAEQLIRAIKKVISGGYYFSPNIMEKYILLLNNKNKSINQSF
jgi:two-component system, NarL family, invasion response regulator UvrY